MKKIFTILFILFSAIGFAQFKTTEVMHEQSYYTNDAANVLYMKVILLRNPFRWEQKIYNQLVFNSIQKEFVPIRAVVINDTVFTYLPKGQVSLTFNKWKKQN